VTVRSLFLSKPTEYAESNVVSGESKPLQEGVDYYFDERGLMVLTENFLKKRGHCCRNGCRHCPYGYGPEGKQKDYLLKQQEFQKFT
jgi:hypothetical protein